MTNSSHAKAQRRQGGLLRDFCHGGHGEDLLAVKGSESEKTYWPQKLDGLFATMHDMKSPRFTLRTLFILMVLISIPIAWTAYQLDWIRQRHRFLQQKVHFFPVIEPIQFAKAPWSLRLFGELGENYISPDDKSDQAEAAALFPEADIMGYKKPN